MRQRGIACAVCNFRRRKCPQDCILEPYFPQDHPQQFQNAHNLFGVKNMLTTLQNLDDQEKKDEAMRNMIYEANVRAKDPVGGCYRIVLQLKKQVREAARELTYVKELLVEFKLAYGVQNQNQIINDHDEFDFEYLDNQSSLRKDPIKPVCAACRYKRQRCPPDCSLAPYFPYDQNNPDQPRNVHKLFSFNNVSKILTKIDQTRRQEAMRCMIYEANVRAKDPVGGCYRIIRELDRQVREARNELAIVNQRLAFYKPADSGVQNQNEIINDEEFSMKDLDDLRAAFYLDDILDHDDQIGR